MNLPAARALYHLIPDPLEPLVNTLALPSRPRAASLAQGQHRSAKRGQSVEFLEHRGYVPGDELRRIDWRASAKGSRTVVRFGERELTDPVFVLLDRHASLAVAKRWDWARGLAALLAASGLRHEDPVALLTKATPGVRASRQRSMALAMAEALEPAPDLPHSNLAAMLAAVEAAVQGPCRVFCISDWLDLSQGERSHEEVADQLFASARRLHARGAALWGLELLHPDELTLDYPQSDQAICFVDPCGQRPSRIGPPAQMRASYLRALNEHRLDMKARATQAGMQWCPMRSDLSWATQLSEALAAHTRAV